MRTGITMAAATTALLVAATQFNVHADSALTRDKKVLTLSAARQIVAAAEAEATRRGLGVVIVA